MSASARVAVKQRPTRATAAKFAASKNVDDQVGTPIELGLSDVKKQPTATQNRVLPRTRRNIRLQTHHSEPHTTSLDTAAACSSSSPPQLPPPHLKTRSSRLARHSPLKQPSSPSSTASTWPIQPSTTISSPTKPTKRRLRIVVNTIALTTRSKRPLLTSIENAKAHVDAAVRVDDSQPTTCIVEPLDTTPSTSTIPTSSIEAENNDAPVFHDSQPQQAECSTATSDDCPAELIEDNKTEELTADEVLAAEREVYCGLDIDSYRTTGIYEHDPQSMLFATFDETRNIKHDLQKYLGQHCFVCGGVAGKLRRCVHDSCLSRYHAACIDTTPRVGAEYFAFVDPEHVECPRHHCATCFAENYRTTAFRHVQEGRLYQCVYCTNAYHPSCFPAGCAHADYRLVCNQHVRRATTSYPHLPYCFGCRKMFEPTEGASVECDRCLRAFHSTCGNVNTRTRSDARVCYYCINNWAPRRGQFVHVLIDEHFYPAQVAKTEYSDAINTDSYVPVFILGCGQRCAESLQMIPSSFVVPAIAYEPMRDYYEHHPTSDQFLSRYIRKIDDLRSTLPPLLIARANRLCPKFKAQSSNMMSGAVRRALAERYDEYDLIPCKCVQVDDAPFKCFTDSCINRGLSMECSSSCGENCLNGASARTVTDKVEIVIAGFGGYALRATTTIPEGHPIGEYTGTIIDIQKTNQLLEDYEARRNQELPLYIMCIDSSFHINSGIHGNATRFANHSCDPNTKVMRVLGSDSLPHQMLYARRPIEAGEEITFDYSHSWSDYNPRCFCGTDACTGHLARRLKKIILPTGGPPAAFFKDPKKRPSRKRKAEVDPSYNTKGKSNNHVASSTTDGAPTVAK